MTLVDDQRVWTSPSKASFVANGYIVVRGLIPPAQAHAAHAAEAKVPWSSTSVAPSWRTRNTGSKDILNLFTPLLRFRIEACFGNVIDPSCIAGAQYARVDQGTTSEQGMHVDGAADPNQPYVAHYGLLVGVCLTDLSQENSGNLIVWPGSHVLVAEAWRKAAPQNIVAAIHTPLPIAAPKQQLLMQVGDVVITHHLLLHSAGPNTSGAPDRDMAYFRVRPDGVAHRLAINDTNFYESPFRYCYGIL